MNRHDLISDMRKGCDCENRGYCPLEDLIKVNPRIMEQHKLVVRFRGRKPNWENIDWNEAYILWKDEGLAERFAKVYNKDLTYEEIEQRMGIRINKNKKVDECYCQGGTKYPPEEVI